MAISKRLRFEVFKRDGFKCRYCGATVLTSPLHCDHVIPESKGGPTEAANLITACQPCNLGKSNVPLDERKYESALPTEELKEHADQVRAYLKIQKGLSNAKKELEALALQHWESRMGEWHYTLPNYLSRPLKDFGLDKILEAIDITARKGIRSELSQVKYFCGVVKNWRDPDDRKPAPASAQVDASAVTAAKTEAEWVTAAYMISQYIRHRTNDDVGYPGAKVIDSRAMLNKMSSLKLGVSDLFHAIDISEWHADELEQNVLDALDVFASDGVPDNNLAVHSEDEREREISDRSQQELWHAFSIVWAHFTESHAGVGERVWRWFSDSRETQLGHLFILGFLLKAGPSLAELSDDEQRALLIRIALADEGFVKNVSDLAAKWAKETL